MTVPGLKYRHRVGGAVPYWFAPAEAAKRGFKPRAVRLHGTDDEIAAHCARLQAQALTFLTTARYARPDFDLTFGALLDRYLTDPESSYVRLDYGSTHPYTVYAGKLKERIGAVRIDLTDGRDVQRWFKQWAGVDNLKHPSARLPRAHAMLSVLKAAVSFGIVCRLAGCAEFAAILRELKFPHKKPRAYAPTAAQVEAARAAARAAGAPSRALAYAIQFDTTLRQWDVRGVWVPLADPRPSSIIQGLRKWIGPTWGMVDANLVLRLTYGKTEDTSGLRGTYDLSACPMVMEELQHVPAPRSGPLVVDERDGLPYRGDNFLRAWKRDFKAAGIPAGVWNRDLRAGAITEAGMANADRGQLRKVTGHTTDRMIGEVYDRDTLEAHRAIMPLRAEWRKTKG
jgi:hypothetical protein